MFCTNCGKELLSNTAMYCPNCGSKVFFLPFLAPQKRKWFVKAPKLTPMQELEIDCAYRQLESCVISVNSTTNASTFFGRLHFALDILLYLRSFEQYDIFRNSTPTQDYNKILLNLDQTVNDFVQRTMEHERSKLEKMKTEKGKQNAYKRFVTELISDFDGANYFWSGNDMYPHYQGPLFTDKNLEYVEAIWNSDY